MKKILTYVAIFTLLVIGGVATAQNSGWIGTGWITSGSVIQSQPLKANLDYLYDNKVHKPADCSGDDKRVVWEGDEWGCISTTASSTEVVLNCELNGVVVAAGSSIAAYETVTVPFGQSCSQEIRTCTNGTLSGTYPQNSCAVADPNSCLFNGQEIPHGQTITAYQESSVQSPNTCVSQVRSCTNGTLSGTYGQSSCSVTPRTGSGNVWSEIQRLTAENVTQDCQAYADATNNTCSSPTGSSCSTGYSECITEIRQIGGNECAVQGRVCLP